MLEKQDLQELAKLFTASEERMSARMDSAIAASEERMSARMDSAIAASEERMSARMDSAIAASEERMSARMDSAIAASEERMSARMDSAIAASEKRMLVCIDNAITASEKRMKRYINMRTVKAERLALSELDLVQTSIVKKIDEMNSKVVKMEGWYRGDKSRYETFELTLYNMQSRVGALETKLVTA